MRDTEREEWERTEGRGGCCGSGGSCDLQGNRKIRKKLHTSRFVYQHLGIAGPVVMANREECWESAWHRATMQTTLQKNEHSSASFHPITSAMLDKYNRF